MKKVLSFIFLLVSISESATVFECFWDQGTALNTGGTYAWTAETDPSNRLSYNSGNNGWNGGQSVLLRGEMSASAYLSRTLTSTDTVCTRFAIKDSGSIPSGENHSIYSVVSSGATYLVNVRLFNIGGNTRIVLYGDEQPIDTSDALTANTTYQILVNFYRAQSGGVSLQVWNASGSSQVGTTLTNSATSANYDAAYVRVGDYEQAWGHANVFISHITVDANSALSASTTGASCSAPSITAMTQVDTIGKQYTHTRTASGQDFCELKSTYPDSTGLTASSGNLVTRPKTKAAKAGYRICAFDTVGGVRCSTCVYDTLTFVGSAGSFRPYAINKIGDVIADTLIISNAITPDSATYTVASGTIPDGITFTKTGSAKGFFGTTTAAAGMFIANVIMWNNGWKADSTLDSISVSAYNWIYNGTKFNADTSHSGQVVCTTKASMTKLYIWRLVKDDSLSSVSAGVIDSFPKPDGLYILGGE